MQLNDLAKRIHAQNKAWWTDINGGEPIVRNKGELLMLVITELAEAVQGMRKDLMDDHLPHRKMEEVEMADAKIRLLDYVGGFGLQVCDRGAMTSLNLTKNKSEHILVICKSVISIHNYAMADYEDLVKEQIAVGLAINLIEDYCRAHNLDLEGAIEEKLVYNQTRADHQIEQRKLAGGKKF